MINIFKIFYFTPFNILNAYPLGSVSVNVVRQRYFVTDKFLFIAYKSAINTIEELKWDKNFYYNVIV